MDKYNKKSNKESIIQPPNNGNSENSQNIKKENTIKLAGLDDKFPIENFIKLESTQKGKSIHLQTYKYPAANTENKFRGVIYLL
jgi:hypothetical protein